jgi:GDSL-like Lipase/Acylhydrolase family
MRAQSFALVAAALAGVSTEAAFVPATDPAVWFTGRYRANADKSVTFDWESFSAHMNVNAVAVRAILSTTGGVSTRMVSAIAPLGTFAYAPYAAVLVPPNQVVNATIALYTGDSFTVRLFNDLEPAFIGRSGNVNLLGFEVDGQVLAPGPMQPHSLEFVGDSITAGFGSVGKGPCNASDATSSHYNSWSRYVADNLTASYDAIAWSGKGMYANCCDPPGHPTEMMPAYYLQTFGSENYVNDWNFSTYAPPDAMVINLGTNDWHSYTGQAWADQFTYTYLAFLKNATIHYNKPKMPFFLAQGPMNNEPSLYSAVQNVIGNWTASGGVAHFVDLRGLTTDGCGGHPGVIGHQQMASKASEVIATAMGW